METQQNKLTKVKSFLKENIAVIYKVFIVLVLLTAIINTIIINYNAYLLRQTYDKEAITTTVREYELLSRVSNEYIDELNSGEIDISSNIVLDNLVYVDNVEDIKDNVQAETNEKITYYFNDLIITTYVTDQSLKTNIAKFITDTSLQMTITDLDSIVAIDNGYKLGEITDDTSELELLAIKIAEDFNNILQGKEVVNKTITDDARSVINKADSTSVRYINFGKDSLDAETYNLVFVQLSNPDGLVLNMMCKMDEMYRIVSIITL